MKVMKVFHDHWFRTAVYGRNHSRELKLGRENCHRNLQVKHPSAFQAGIQETPSWSLRKALPTSSSVFTYTRRKWPYPAILSHLQEGSISPPHRHPRGYQLPPREGKIRLSPPPRGGSSPFSLEQNAGFSFSQSQARRSRPEQARIPPCIPREAIPAAGSSSRAGAL